jgi:uncharacterized protein
MVRATVASLAIATLSLPAAWACNRTPPEEFPTSTASAPVAKLSPPAAPEASVRPAEASRCMVPTPGAPPPPVAPGPAPGCPKDDEISPRKLPVVRVNFAGADGGAGPSVEAEFARGEHDTRRGLMFRKSMPEEHGMLFDLDVRGTHDFWMHNTCIPLDLIYVDEDGFIVGIVENAPTLDDESRGVGQCLSRYVLEMNAGWSRRHGVRAGQHMTVPQEAR